MSPPPGPCQAVTHRFSAHAAQRQNLPPHFSHYSHTTQITGKICQSSVCHFQWDFKHVMCQDMTPVTGWDFKQTLASLSAIKMYSRKRWLIVKREMFVLRWDDEMAHTFWWLTFWPPNGRGGHFLSEWEESPLKNHSINLIRLAAFTANANCVWSLSLFWSLVGQ